MTEKGPTKKKNRIIEVETNFQNRGTEKTGGNSRSCRLFVLCLFYFTLVRYYKGERKKK